MPQLLLGEAPESVGGQEEDVLPGLRVAAPDPTNWPFRARFAAAAVSGLSMAAAFPPLDQHWVAFIALVPLTLAVRGARAREGLVLGLVAGLAFFAILFYWISYFGYLAWILLSLLEAAFWAVFGAVAARTYRLGAGARVLALPVVWAGLEVARGRWPFGGFTWGDLGYSQVEGLPVVHLARWAGIFGVTAAIVCVNMLITEAIVRGTPLRRVAVALASGAGLVFAPALVSLDVASFGTTEIAGVQGSVPRGHFTSLGRTGSRTGSEDFVVRDNHVRLTEQLVGDPPDLIVWPENALDRDPRTTPGFFDPVADVVRRVGAKLIAGAILDEAGGFQNAAVEVFPDGRLYSIGAYEKQHLVPFGEYVPLGWARKVVPVLDREIPSDGIPGRGPGLFPVTYRPPGGSATPPTTHIATVICFESTYAELVRRSVVARDGASSAIVVMTNNASFGTSPAASQHLQMSRMRSIEHGRPVVHVAVAGISAVVRVDGSVERRTRLFTPALLRATLPLTAALSPYARIGGALELSFLVVAAVSILLLPLWRRAP